MLHNREGIGIFFHSFLFMNIMCVQCPLFSRLTSVSEWELQSALDVAGQPNEALLPCTAGHSYTLSVLLLLCHGSAVDGAGA